MGTSLPVAAGGVLAGCRPGAERAGVGTWRTTSLAPLSAEGRRHFIIAVPSLAVPALQECREMPLSLTTIALVLRTP